MHDRVQNCARFRVIENAIRPFVLFETADGELRAAWPDERLWRALESAREDRGWQGDLASRLERCFRGEVVEFSDIATPDGPPFHRACWSACRAIPRGEVWSYRRLAEAAGSGAGASRAAGQAMRSNPLPVIVPCHRVVAASGRLHGFAGSSDPDGEALDMKRRLLELEGAPVPRRPPSLFEAAPSD